jgi:hypothetical protein
MNRIKSAKKQTIDGILFLKGVYKSDCKKLEDIFHDRLLHDAKSETKQYDKIPLIFYSLDTWPKSTNLLCWGCNRSFKSRPWFEPQSIGPVSTGEVGVFLTGEEIKKIANKREYCISAKGNFCSANCVRRYIIMNARDLADRNNKLAMLNFLYEIFTGKTMTMIQNAIKHTEMVQYGGSLTLAEYQKKMDELDTEYIRDVADNNFSNICRSYIESLTEDVNL